MTQHAPGPWNFRLGSSPHHQGQVSSESTGVTVAITYSDENGANGLLIAAAPELLAVCEWAISHIDNRKTNLIEAMQSAIAKARGQ